LPILPALGRRHLLELSIPELHRGMKDKLNRAFVHLVLEGYYSKIGIKATGFEDFSLILPLRISG
jgi:hypothetical protein